MLIYVLENVITSYQMITKRGNQVRTAVIRTTDRAVFKECRRRWDWSSHLRQNLQPITTAAPLWMGSMLHYALEDFHGENIYRTPAHAVEAYTYAFLCHIQKSKETIPDDWIELTQLCMNMMAYYSDYWLPRRTHDETYPTLNYKGKLQTEVNVKMQIPWETLEAVAPKERVERIKQNYDEIYYSLQFDRVAIDQYGQVWVVEYKSAKSIQTAHYLTDPQITAYLCAAELLYGETHSVAGVMYQQHKKAYAKIPQPLKSGKISVAQNQATSHALYREALIAAYGDVKTAPKENIDYLNNLALEETSLYDPFVRRDLVTRNVDCLNNFFEMTAMEVVDMLDPQLLIYPNLTRQCSAMCSFWGPCVAKDSGDDFKDYLTESFQERPTSYDNWRHYLPPADFNWTIDKAFTGKITL